MCTVTGLSHQPRSRPRRPRRRRRSSPEALVSPAPRSQTSTVSSCARRRGRAGRSCARGTARAPRSAGRGAAARRASARRARMTACGLPTETAVSSTRSSLELDRLDLPHLDVADVHRDRSVVADGCRVRRARQSRSSRRSAPVAAASQRGGDPAAVAGHLRHGAVGVPDHDLGLRVLAPRRPRARRRSRSRSGRRRAGARARRRAARPTRPLDEQVAVTERVPLREPHPPPLPRAGPRRS